MNPADIVVLHKLYNQPTDPPPVDLIRIPQFLELLIDALFKKGSKINQEHKSKYIYLLAYASSVCDNWNFKRGTRKSLNKDELKGMCTIYHFLYEIFGICVKYVYSSVTDDSESYSSLVLKMFLFSSLFLRYYSSRRKSS